MRIFLILISLLKLSIAYSQTDKQRPKLIYKVDTLVFSKDTSSLFIQEIWDSTVVRSYYCSVDSADLSFHYGFLKMKKGIVRKYTIKNIHKMTTYPLPEKYRGLRDFGGGSPVTIHRLK